MVGVTNSTPATVNRSQRIIAYLIAGFVLLSLAAFIAVVVATGVGAGANDGFSHGLWPAVIMLPWFALPAAMLSIIVLLIVSARSRAHSSGNTKV